MEAGARARRAAVRARAAALLRLQKMHILVGQDTDSESTPFGAAMPWIVKLDKEEDFIGRWALERYAEQQLETALVGFTMANGHVPTEGAAVARLDGTAGRPRDELALLAAARQGHRAWPGCRPRWPPTAPRSRSPTAAARCEAEVVTRPFYDPDGEVLRS